MFPAQCALTPPTLVLAGLRAALAQEVPNLSFVFDPSLSWGEAAKAQRAQRYMQQGTTEEGAMPDQSVQDPTQYPLMAWNRSTLTPMEGQSRRNVFGGVVEIPSTSERVALQLFYGQLVFGFKIYSRDILELEAIEMGYVARSLISDITGFAIPIETLYPDLNTQGVPEDVWKYDVQWDPLDAQQEVERIPVVRFSIQGTATIRGSFLTGGSTSIRPVSTIDLSLKNLDGALLDEVIVHR